MGFGLVIGFIDHLQIVITSNHIALTNSSTRILTTVHNKSYTSTLRVAWQRLSTGQLPQLLCSTAPVLGDWRSVCLGYIAADLRQWFLACHLAIHDPRFFFSPRYEYVRVSKWGLLFEGGGVGLFMSVLRLLHRGFSIRVFALLRCPGHYRLCIRCNCTILNSTYTKYTKVSSQWRLVHHLMPCMYKGWVTKTNPYTAAFEDLLCL
jgi:hypothetical protein